MHQEPAYSMSPRTSRQIEFVHTLIFGNADTEKLVMDRILVRIGGARKMSTAIIIVFS